MIRTFKDKNENGEGRHYRRFAREWAMQFLFQTDLAKELRLSDSSLNLFLSQLEDTSACNDPKAFRRASKAADKLIRGVFENLERLDAVISDSSDKWALDRIDAVDRNIMRVAVFEMLFEEKVPLVVSINEAVEIGKIYGSENTSSFVNGILNAVKESIVKSQATEENKDED